MCVQEILLGEAGVVLTGGTENMSQAPYAVRNIRWGTTLGQDLKVPNETGCPVQYMCITCIVSFNLDSYYNA